MSNKYSRYHSNNGCSSKLLSHLHAGSMICGKLVGLFLLAGLLQSVSILHVGTYSEQCLNLCINTLLTQTLISGNFTLEVDVRSFSREFNYYCGIFCEFFINEFCLDPLNDVQPSCSLAQSSSDLLIHSGLPRKTNLTSTQPWPVWQAVTYISKSYNVQL